MAEQINIFVENKPGRINNITRILTEANINLRAIVIADRDAFGVVKILVNDPRRAQLALSENGLACAFKKVLAVVLNDNPGGLHDLTEMLTKNGINILDAYGFVVESTKSAVLCIEVKDYESTKDTVQKNGFRVLNDEELYEL